MKWLLNNGSLQDDCQNYVRVLVNTNNHEDPFAPEKGRLLVCGTNAYNPRCRYYSNGVTVDEEFSGKGFCPYDPRHNSTAIFTGQ